MSYGQENFHDLLSYNRDTGALTWRARSRGNFSTLRAHRAWNARFADRPAGRIGGKGYVELTILGRRYSAHRLAWRMVFGQWPDGEIDHINGNKADNRLSNLRAVSHSENGRNQPLPSCNSSGRIGVSWNAKAGKWCARITAQQKTHFLGYFDHFDQACAARAAAETEYGFHANHGRLASASSGQANMPAVQPSTPEESRAMLVGIGDR